MQYDCLMVDDESSIAQTTAEYFNLFGVQTAFVLNYDEALRFMEEHQVSLILLDINLGDRSGFALCKELREHHSQPILFVSARTSDDDILTALNIGGDDYIKKPYTLSILLAKVKAVLKRCASSPEETSCCICGPVSLDCESHQALRDGRTVKLKEMEYRLLLYFFQNPGRVLSKDELLREVWQNQYVGEGTLSVHIRHLREKLEEDPNEPAIIKTVWGTGYRMERMP